MNSKNILWTEFTKNGFEHGDDITYFDFVEMCQNIDIDPDEINLEEFCEKYNVNIG